MQLLPPGGWLAEAGRLKQAGNRGRRQVAEKKSGRREEQQERKQGVTKVKLGARREHKGQERERGRGGR